MTAKRKGDCPHQSRLLSNDRELETLLSEVSVTVERICHLLGGVHPWPPGDILFFFANFNAREYIMHREMEKHFREYGLTSAQFSVLEALYSKGDLNVSQIQETILGTPGNVPVIINNLVKAGYVERTQDSKDRRISVVSLTESGRQQIEKIYPQQHQFWLEQILSVCSEDDKRALARLLIKTYDAVRRDLGAREAV